MRKLIKLLNKNIIIITLVGTFVMFKTPAEIFEEVEGDILRKINIETKINKNIFD
ncbi:hypothetical protein QTI99_10330 [Clostridium perfringens]|uniref:hypothetical protein n=1 Tax=Clostridium perfringens TaxID=1502 RepID=UPI0029FA02D9|nr:hypothetical protein [Clostridium perfringens]EJT6171449.1 hypothetical protein [Clostridium perfringens]EJT6542174.1 hypothetical protein [Clostridium perfringens]EJT6567182.1 hypothetical protein [Clostridium perfringens]MBS5995296.1 hypothetical protein [Clostridium perfringens]MDM0997867.1 hypothetical protein [Clostridium perfringens]